MNFADVESQSAIGSRYAGEQNGTMFIVIAREQMRHQCVEIGARNSDKAGIHDASFSRKSRIFKTFVGTRCEPLCAAVFRLET